MELDQLKSAWNKLASENKEVLAEDQIKKILSRRTLNISEKIARNIRIGMIIIFTWVALGITIDLISSPLLGKMLDKPYLSNELMFWAFFVDILIYLLIIATLVIFWIKYNRIEKSTSENTSLRNNIQRLIGVLSSYKRMFYIVLWIVLFYVAAAFSTGFFMEYSHQAKSSGLRLQEMEPMALIIVIVIFLLSLGVLAGLYYLLFNIFFKRLYGQYLNQLRGTLRELDDPDQSGQ